MDHLLFNVFACVLAFPLLILGVNNDVYVPIQPNICQDTYNITFLTTPVHDFYPPIDFTNFEDHLLNSKMACAFKAKFRMALGFSYTNGVCTIYGPGQGIWNEDIVSFGPHFLPPMGTMEEVAYGKATYSSGINLSFPSPRAIDDGGDKTFFLTLLEDINPWWMVDVGEVRKILQVQIMPRQQCCHSHFKFVEIRVGNKFVTNGDFSSYTLMSTYPGPYQGSRGRLICTRAEGIYGRYISIQIIPTNTVRLQMGHVSIYALK